MPFLDLAGWAALASTLPMAASGAIADGNRCAVEAVVLGAGQDAGAPQIGNAADPGPRLLPVSLAVIEHEAGQRYLFDATPAITEQLHALDRIAPPDRDTQGGLGLDGVFLTHAHIGHYLGLAHFGFEAASARKQRVFAMPRMAEFLRGNGPWSQLVEFENIEIFELADQQLVPLTDAFGVWPLLVPHRDEYSETVGFLLMTPGKTALYLPDIDGWEEWEEQTGNSLESVLDQVDYAFIDSSFWDDNELPGRDMSAIPHPRTKATMERLAKASPETRAKVHFIHYNHTNPIRDPASAQSAEVSARGFSVARRGMRFCLSE